MFYNIVTLGVANVTPILGGYVSQLYGWRMMFRILFAFTGLALIAIIFACPEHAYVRPTVFETDVNSTTDLASSEQEKNGQVVGSSTAESESGDNRDAAQGNRASPAVVSGVAEEKPLTYLEELKPFNGFITRQNPLVLLARPFACFLYPAVFWGFTVGGLWSAWVSTALLLCLILHLHDANRRFSMPTDHRPRSRRRANFRWSSQSV